MQEVDPFLIMKSYNLISAAITGVYIVVRWPVMKQSPFEMIWCKESTIMLFSACVAHIIA